MKTTIATILLTLAASQANADGFYQQVIGNSQQHAQEIQGEATEFTYTPLYRQVTKQSSEISKQEMENARVVPEFAYTPLYRKVTGQAG